MIIIGDARGQAQTCGPEGGGGEGDDYNSDHTCML